MKKSEHHLRYAIKGNAIFSISSALTLLLSSRPIAKIMNLSAPNSLVFIGIGLFIFAITLFHNAFRKELKSTQIRFIIIQDWLWVIGSLILLIWNPFGISMIGNYIIAGVALIVTIFAILQHRTLNNFVTEGK
ncbi:MAG: hypothetical protein ACPGGA_02260 [Balneolaceae bacterium]